MHSDKTATSKTTRPTTEFDTVSDALAYANQVADRAEALADALLGSEPGANPLSTVSETPDGALPRLAMSAQYSHRRLADAMAALDRIQRALP